MDIKEMNVKETFCDSCGKPCTNLIANIQVEIVHYTNDYKIVGHDGYNTVGICKDCMEVIKRIIPQAFRLLHGKNEYTTDSARMGVEENVEENK